MSVLFCDLVGFTTFSEARDPEDVRETLAEYFAIARRAIEDYGGTVEKFIGDAVMAVWGAPVAREDDAERSVRAGLDLTSAVAQLARRLAMPELQVRVGILTGEAAVDVGRTHEGMVIGDAVNTAARIQSVADPGAVFVDDVTRLASERSIAFEPAGVHQVKGKSVPVRMWRAVRILARVGGGGRESAVEPPLVGRDGPLEALREALARLLAGDGAVQLVSLVGEAGIGKSRLVWEFEKHVDGLAARIAWHVGRAFSFGRGAAFSPVAEMVRARAGIAPDDHPERQRERMMRLLARVIADDVAERERAARAVFRLLELDDGEEQIEPGELFSAWRGLFEAIAVDAPVVLVFEELQESDDALLAFIGHLVEWSDFPLLILAVGRPDSRVDAISATSRIDLEPLRPHEMESLLAGTVRGPPRALIDAVQAEGGGVPLYAVETLRALADRGVLAVEDAHYVVHGEIGELALAPTIRALIASRLDGLGALERSALTGGAIIGERFSGAAAAAVAGIDPQDAVSLLGGLVRKAFLAHDTAPEGGPRARYAFLQGAVRRVSLGTLSRRERKRLHLAAAHHLGDVTEPERAAALAGHLVAAMEADPRGDDVAEIRMRAQSALRLAAERAAAVGALADALSLFDRAIELSDDERARAALLEAAGLVAFRAGLADPAAMRWGAAAELHAAAGRQRSSLAARTQRLRMLQYERSPNELLPQLRELDAALADIDDHASALAAATLSFTLYQLGEPEESLAVASRAARVAEACADWAELIHALGQEASALAELQRPDEAIAVYHKALEVAAAHEPRLLAILWDSLAISLASVGRYRDTVAATVEAFSAAERSSERIAERWARLVLGRALCSLGEWDRAIAEIESVKDVIPPIQVGMALAPLVVIALARGDSTRVRALVDEHDARLDDPEASVYDRDFRTLRRAVRAEDGDELARVIPEAEPSDFAEWSGWLAPVVDKLLAVAAPDALEAALSALRANDPMKQTAPVRAQAARIAGHLAADRGESAAARAELIEAAELAAGCELAFELAVLELERCELTGEDSGGALARARETFTRVGATPWLERTDGCASRV